ncbi:hypothetical protein NDU88_013350 [Pleurodeles waltl]|uniref:Uncharacterized protein n=1 Tax=Pleurodeles waltl TaxID=8319 RepID=A0AAV7R2W6_PLEWA|nr:hypothetical protein NDU88_013350 [Pleurodeles waltl]
MVQGPFLELKTQSLPLDGALTLLMATGGPCPSERSSGLQTEESIKADWRAAHPRGEPSPSLDPGPARGRVTEPSPDPRAGHGSQSHPSRRGYHEV